MANASTGLDGVPEPPTQDSPPPPDDTPPGPPTRGWRHTFRALRHRNFRIFVSGQTVSLIGTWMQNLSQSWLIYRLTGSELLVGVLGFSAHIPVLLLGPFAGLAADRYSRYHIVLLTQTAFLLQAVALAVLTLTGKVTALHVFALAAVWGVVNAFDIPSRQSLYIHMVGKEDLINAISLNSVIFNTARMAGPAIAGLLIAAFGEGVCFSINAVTFLAVIGSLLLLRIPATVRGARDSPFGHLRDGFRYAYHHRPILALLLINSAVNITRAPAVALAPFFADAIFGQGSEGLGILTGAAGVGAVTGTLGLASRTHTRGLPQTVLYSALTTGSCLVLFAWSPSFVVSVLVFAAIGFSHMRQNASTNTLIQSLIPDEYRGRIMALYSMTVVGVLPLGHLAGGAIAEQIGARWTVFGGGLLCLSAGLFFRTITPRLQHSIRKREQV
ncbi:MAG: MFS transporter [bacterium]|nr:MFS transporter [bacterium]